MKVMKKALMAAVIGLSLTTSGVAIAQGWGRGAGSGYAECQRPEGPFSFMREEMTRARLSVLTEVTAQSEETIQAKLRNKPLWAVLDEFNVDFDTYRAKMQEKHAAVIGQAVGNGKITQAQADFMLSRRAAVSEGEVGRRGRGGKQGGRGPDRF
jgi:hypothetical protein